MFEISLNLALWISFTIIAFASVFLFFGKTFRLFTASSALILTGISFQILNIDFLQQKTNGQIIVLFLWLLYLFQILAFYALLKTNAKLHSFFYALPFLSFLTIALSLDLITLLLGVTMFSISFLGLYALRGKEKLHLLTDIRKAFVAFLSFCYGMACLYARIGTISIKDLFLKLNKGNWDDAMYLGVGLITLSILVEIYTVIPQTRKKK